MQMETSSASRFTKFSRTSARAAGGTPQVNWWPPPCQYHQPIPIGHAEAWGGWTWSLLWLALVAGVRRIGLATVQNVLDKSLRAFPTDWKNVQQISDVESGGVRLHHFWRVGTAGVPACAAASHYPLTLPSLSRSSTFYTCLVLLLG